MEILTYLKANIRYKKGAFISIFLMMMIISASLTAVLSTMDDCEDSIRLAHEAADTGDICVYISDRRYTGELKDALNNHPLVQKAEDVPAVCADLAVIGEHEYENTMFCMKMYDHMKLIDESGTAYEKETPRLKPGEIYVPKGLLTNIDGKTGDMLTLKTIGGTYEFEIKGVVLEPFQGAFVIGFKQMFVSDEDFDTMLADVNAAETKERTAVMHRLMLYKSDSCRLTDAQFRREVNLDTGIIDQGNGSLTRAMSTNYTSLFPKVIAGVLFVFLVLLTVIVLIVMGHSISSGIEMDYVNLGILKACGFLQEQIRLVFVLQYLLAQVLGAGCGIICSFPLIRFLSKALWPITAVIMKNELSLGKSAGVLGAVIVLSGLFIFFITAKVGKISPVRAIAGGRKEVYFDSRLKAPILKKGLSISLAFRQFTSGRRMYGASVLVAAFLVFFMMTMMLLAGALTSKTAAKSIGQPWGECGVEFKKTLSEDKRKEIEETIENYSAVETAYYWDIDYLSLNGEEVMCTVYRDPKQFAMLKGRAPLYENEIVITDILSEELDLAMGDEVIIGYHDKRKTYLISGIYQCSYDVGQCFGVSSEGAQKMGFQPVYTAAFCLKQPEMAEEAAKALNQKYGDILEAEQDAGTIGQTYQAAIDAVRIVIFSFSVMFALVTVQMVCAKIFLREKTDTGIYKAVGFSVSGLRFQFALRFLITAAAGSAAGIVLSVLLSGRLLSGMLRNMGIVNMYVEYTAAAVMIPVVLICACFFLFAYFATGRIKRLEVRELVTE